MAITHTWQIRKLVQKNDGTGTVIQVYFKVHSNDGMYYYVSAGNVELDVDNISNFVAYADLTEMIVIGWVHDKLGPSLGGYEQINEDWINSAKTPSTTTIKIEKLPWEPDPTPTPTPEPTP
jgi:hypothetical protein